MLDLFETISARESCRDFTAQTVEREKLTKCVEAARLAPSACNGQPWNFYIVSESVELVEKVRECLKEKGMNKFTDKAPAFIVITEESTTLTARVGGAIKKHDYPQTDIGIAAAHIVLAATAQGLGSCILGWFEEKKLKEELGIKSAKRIRLVIALGYAEDKPLRTKKRKPAEDIFIFK
ncbi:MAG: nitroreductase family protein [Clostridia bacterium]